MELPGTVDPVQYVSYCSCSVIERIKNTATDPARECPWQPIKLDIWISLLTNVFTYITYN